MFIYANGFQVSVKDDKSELLIRFTQTSPVFNRSIAPGAEIREVNEEVVASIVLNGALAEAFASNVQELIKKPNPNQM